MLQCCVNKLSFTSRCRKAAQKNVFDIIWGHRGTAAVNAVASQRDGRGFDPPSLKSLHVRQSGNSELAAGMIASGCLSVSDPVMNCQLVQGATQDNWD